MKRMDEKDGWDWIEMKPEVNLLIPETGRRMIAQCTNTRITWVRI